MIVTLAGAGALLAGCGQAGGAAAATVVTSTSIATVDSGADCIPDLNTTHISLAALQPGGATGVVPSTDSAQQVREGAVPAPPNAWLVSQGNLARQATGAGAGSPSLPGRISVSLYETSCAPGDVQAYYVAALLQNQWAGSFVPASGATTTAKSTSAPVHGANVTLFDLKALTSGRFVNIHPTGDAVAFITVVAAIEAPGTPLERHPTLVQIIIQPSAGTADTPTLPPTAATTPNVGASAAPPNTSKTP